MKNKTYLLLPVLSGILTAVSFQNEHFSFIVFISLIPLFVFILKSERSALKALLIFYFSYGIFLFSWVSELKPVIPAKEPFSSVIIILGLLIMSAVSTVRIVAAMFFYSRIKTDSYFDVISFSFLFILGEWIQEKAFFMPFPWARLGVIAAPITAFVQSASLFGSLFISFLILLINGSIAYTIVHRNKISHIYSAGLTVTVCITLNLVYGLISMTNQSGENYINVCLVQGNFPGINKWTEPTEKMLDSYIELTKNSTSADTDIVFWPESAVPIFLNLSENESKIISDFTNSNNITIITGSFYKANTSMYNSVYISDKNGEIKCVYSKKILVPIGENIPLYNLISKVSFLGSMTANLECYSAGKDSGCIKTDIGSFAGMICYESIFPCVSREAVRHGGEYIAIISNDSWFNDSEALYQHHSHAVMRAIENRRYTVCCSNTAITSVIDDKGNIVKTAKKHISTALLSRIITSKKTSLYTKFGDIIVIPGIILWLKGLLAFVREKAKRTV
jgi:apolipoprotein N-acyltransferase